MYLYIKEQDTHQLVNLIKFETISKKKIDDNKYTLALYKEQDKSGSPSVTAGYYSKEGIDKILDDLALKIESGKRMYELPWFDK